MFSYLCRSTSVGVAVYALVQVGSESRLNARAWSVEGVIDGVCETKKARSGEE